MPIAGKVIPGKMKREDYPLYPPPAFREAVANSICHRDYTFAGGAVAIAMYDNHLEVINPGSFHFDITPKKLTLPHESRPWNPLIANTFYCSGIIESWGSGTLNILDGGSAGAAKTISAVTLNDPVRLDFTAVHGWTTDDLIWCDSSVGGTWQLRWRYFKVTVIDTDTVTLQGEDSTGAGTQPQWAAFT
ncbi:hypothetical protein LCGC14_2135380, partial [marine sediment metagenome]